MGCGGSKPAEQKKEEPKTRAAGAEGGKEAKPEDNKQQGEQKQEEKKPEQQQQQQGEQQQQQQQQQGEQQQQQQQGEQQQQQEGGAGVGAGVVVVQGGAKKEEKKKISKATWQELDANIPYQKDEETTKKREKLWTEFDPNGNGYLSLAEVDASARKILRLDEITNDLAPILMRAFTIAKDARPGKGKDATAQNDYVERVEFRILLQYIRNYFELWVMFDEIDTTDDKRVTLVEFEKAIPLLNTWGANITDAAASFSELDKNGGGVVLFDEFSTWALAKGLDVTDD